ncbi:hypothetical protein [Phenylobacterium sp.]|uniref:hypothetical protein n=1 Tax=Phenylobacterium sp. TaxID=1871053 RepID=UPI0027254BD9|nr:hypothetical protein [Phenylobacterium sp.]MDO8381023.1 hypothetical protein [Phenylobacterium sp.]
MADSKAEYRRIRNGWGLVLATVWIAYRWMTLDAAKRAALATLTNCEGLINGAKCAWNKGAIESAFSGGVLAAVLISPLALVATHYFARWRVESNLALAARQKEQQRSAAQLAQQREREQRMMQVEGDASKARQSLDRGEFIHKLGTVGDFLDLLAHESDPSRMANIRLGASQALRDLTAKHPLDQLSDIVAADTGVRLSLESVLGRLATSALDGSGEAQVLSAALAGATPSSAPSQALTADSVTPP